MNLRNKKITSFLLLTLVFSSILFLNFSLNSAQAQLLEGQEGFGTNGSITAAYGEATGEVKDVRTVAVGYIKYFLTFLGLVFLVLIILSGYKWMISNGNEEEIKKAKGQLIAAIIGMFIVLSSYALLNFIYKMSIRGLDGTLNTPPV